MTAHIDKTEDLKCTDNHFCKNTHSASCIDSAHSIKGESNCIEYHNRSIYSIENMEKVNNDTMDFSRILKNPDSSENLSVNIRPLLDSLYKENNHASDSSKLDVHSTMQAYVDNMLMDFLNINSEFNKINSGNNDKGLYTFEQHIDLDSVIDSKLGIPRTPSGSFHENSLQYSFNEKNIPFNEDILAYLKFLKLNIVDKSTRVSNPSMIGHMTTSLPFFQQLIAKIIVTMNQNVVKIETSSAVSNLERITIAMMHAKIYNDGDENAKSQEKSQTSKAFYEKYIINKDEVLGICTSGGTVANIAALWCARNICLGPDKERGFEGISDEGLFSALKHYSYEGAVVIGPDTMHYSFTKTMDILGLGSKNLIMIPTDNQFKMDIEQLETTIIDLKKKRICIIALVAVCGTTEAGAIDDFELIGDISKKYNIHLHVDAAWGGPLIYLKEFRKTKLKYIANADTISIDAHKQLYTPIGLGMLFFKDPKLSTYIKRHANYIIREDSHDLGKFTVEGSRPANVLHLHASLSILGEHGIELLLQHGLKLTKTIFSMMIKSFIDDSNIPNITSINSFFPIHHPETNIMMFVFVPTSIREKFKSTIIFSQDNLHDFDIKWTAEIVDECSKSNITIQKMLSQNSFLDVKKDNEQSSLGGFLSRTVINVKLQDNLEKLKCLPLTVFRMVISNPLTELKDILNVLHSANAVSIN